MGVSLGEVGKRYAEVYAMQHILIFERRDRPSPKSCLLDISAERSRARSTRVSLFHEPQTC